MIKDDSEPDNTGLVNLSIKVKRLSRQERKVIVAVVERGTAKTVFKSVMRDEQSGSDESARKKAERVARAYCFEQDYIVKETLDNLGGQKPTVRTVDKRTR